MNKYFILIGLNLFLSIGFLFAQRSVTTAIPHATALRCEYLDNPLGIDRKQPHLGWLITTKDTALKNIRQTGYQVLVASSPVLLERGTGDLWDSKKIISDNSAHVIYKGKNLSSEQACYWKVRIWTSVDNGKEQASFWSESAMWSMGLLTQEDWKGKWIGLNGDNEVKDTVTEHRRLAARMLRKEFNLTKKIEKAYAYICGVGFYDMYVNGKLVNDQLMNPALAGYNKRLLYSCFDVSEQLKNGGNAIGIVLGNGRFFAPRKKVPVPMHNYGYPRALMQLNIRYTDGTKQTIITNEQWKTTSDGPIRANNEYDGEEYDARMEMPGWCNNGFNDSQWKTAEILEAPGGAMESMLVEPIRITDVLQPQKILQPKPGIWMIDFGQAFYGSVRLKVSGPGGTVIKMHSSFNILPDGTLKYQNDRSALNMDIYTLKGGGTESWHPRFKGNAIRWVQVEGFPGTPTLENFEGLVIHTDFEHTGNFESSNTLLNRVYLNAVWGTRMQNRSLPMEPDRDERMPWSGHPAKTSESEGWVFNVKNFYDHFLHNYRAHQADDGSLQEILPPYWTFNSKGILWPSVATIIPDWMYNFYGDEEILRTNYSMMKHFVEFTVKTYLKPDYTTDKCDYGDWVNALNMGGSGKETPKALLGTAYLYNNCRIVQRAAKILGYQKDEQAFRELADKIDVAFNQRFLDKQTGVYESGSQCAYVLPLAFGLVPKEQYDKVVNNLVKDIIVTRRGHTSVGLIGMQWQMQVLTNIGKPEVAYTIATQTDLPSWGYMISKGATTSWELWNSDTTGPGMNGESQKILSGNFEAWCYQTLAGINYDVAQPGFRHIILKPEPVGDLKFVKGSFKSLYGIIRSEWEIKNDFFEWKFSVPPNTKATVYVPTTKTQSIRLNGKSISVDQSKAVDNSPGKIQLQLGSGNYTIVCEK